LKISKTLISQEEIENKISEIADLINSKYKGEELVVVGILKGAFIVVSDLAKKLELDVTFDFMKYQIPY
jgi:Hypoxanthine-guanine phosphoribosyltransferase